ncbi:hypothetical protein BpHYR1_035522 [Brachionus plicatilis]|uniref:Uncharacterized protein n=1 Tax=Brachionus plicatilis TaxID=10195 RepID=A0A3M7QZM7_BRAPC|nr:hypothetical protein BpHYR1_035522 [Brachionus plicatilis]
MDELLKRLRGGVYDYTCISTAKELIELDDIESISKPLTDKEIVNMVSQSSEIKIEEDIQAEVETEKITFKDPFESFNCCWYTAGSHRSTFQRLPLQDIPIQQNIQNTSTSVSTPVVYNKNGSVRKPLGRKKGSTIKSKK